MNKLAILLLVSSLILLNGCVELNEMEQKAKQFLSPPEKFIWLNKINQSTDFGLLDMINKDMAKVDEYPLIIHNSTKYLRIHIHASFSKPLGSINVTVVSPSKNESRKYSTLGKSCEYDDYFYYDTPEPGNWKIVIKVSGIGSYKILARAYQPS